MAFEALPDTVAERYFRGDSPALRAAAPCGYGYAPSALVAAATRHTPRALGVVPSQPS